MASLGGSSNTYTLIFFLKEKCQSSNTTYVSCLGNSSGMSRLISRTTTVIFLLVNLSFFSFSPRFVCTDTVEERIKCLQERKLALADNVLTGSKNTQASKLTLQDLKMLFGVGLPQPEF